MMRGYARVPGGGWRTHGEPKRVREWHPSACAALHQLEDGQAWGLAVSPPRLPELRRLRRRYECFSQVPEYRQRRGIRHSLPTLWSILMVTKRTGGQGVVTIGELAARLTQQQLAAVHGFRSPSQQRYIAPSRPSFHPMLSAMPPPMLDAALSRFMEQNRSTQWAAKQPRPSGPHTDHLAAPQHTNLDSPRLGNKPV